MSFGDSKTIKIKIPNECFVNALQKIAYESGLSLDLLLLQELDKSKLFENAREKMLEDILKIVKK